jgi:hypothetical protein
MSQKARGNLPGGDLRPPIPICPLTWKTRKSERRDQTGKRGNPCRTLARSDI